MSRIVLLSMTCLLGFGCQSKDESNPPLDLLNIDATCEYGMKCQSSPDQGLNESNDVQPDGHSDAARSTDDCVSTSCAENNAACGSVPDGCGGILDCGQCASGQQCVQSSSGRFCDGGSMSALCGNGVLELGEQCDGNQFVEQVAACPDGKTGSPTCDEMCMVSFDNCLSRPVCGDGVVNSGFELCDGNDVQGRQCADFGFLGGGLRCDSDCNDFSYIDCEQRPYLLMMEDVRYLELAVDQRDQSFLVSDWQSVIYRAADNNGFSASSEPMESNAVPSDLRGRIGETGPNSSDRRLLTLSDGRAVLGMLSFSNTYLIVSMESVVNGDWQAFYFEPDQYYAVDLKRAPNDHLYMLVGKAARVRNDVDFPLEGRSLHLFELAPGADEWAEVDVGFGEGNRVDVGCEMGEITGLNVDHSMTLGPNHRPIIVRLDCGGEEEGLFVYERDGVWQQERFSIDGVEFDNKQPSLVFHEQTNQAHVVARTVTTPVRISKSLQGNPGSTEVSVRFLGNESYVERFEEAVAHPNGTFIVAGSTYDLTATYIESFDAEWNLIGRILMRYYRYPCVAGCISLIGPTKVTVTESGRVYMVIYQAIDQFYVFELTPEMLPSNSLPE